LALPINISEAKPNDLHGPQSEIEHAQSHRVVALPLGGLPIERSEQLTALFFGQDTRAGLLSENGNRRYRFRDCGRTTAAQMRKPQKLPQRGKVVSRPDGFTSAAKARGVSPNILRADASPANCTVPKLPREIRASDT
jgi:hypothetical protein